MKEEKNYALNKHLHTHKGKTDEPKKERGNRIAEIKRWTGDAIKREKAYRQPEKEEMIDKAHKTRTRIIPFNGKILTPTLKQLKEFKGDLRLIENRVGCREPRPDEKNFRIRFSWKNFIMWPTPEQLKLAEGDMNKLLRLCDHKLLISSNNSSFQEEDSRSSSTRNSIPTFD